MSKWDKLLSKICSLSKDLRFDELCKVLKSYGYEMNSPRKQPLYISQSRMPADNCTKT